MHIQSHTRCQPAAVFAASPSTRPAPRPAPPAAVRTPFSTLGSVALRELDDLRTDVPPNLQDMQLRASDEVSYVSRRRLDAVDFDIDEVDAEGLPLVYNEEALRRYVDVRVSTV